MTPKEVSSQAFSMPAHTGWYFTNQTYQQPPSKLDPSKVKLPKNTVVCITGAGRGLGESFALAYAKAGAAGIIICSRSTHELHAVSAKITAINPEIKVSVVACDVASEESVKELAAIIKKDHGRLDILINNAGYLDVAGWKPITEGEAEDWKKVFDVNVFGVYLVTRNLLPLLLSSDNSLKTVIGITSMSSHWAGPSIAMGMSKLALNRFIEFLAEQYKAEGLMAYSLHPGGVPTAMSQDPKVVPKELSASERFVICSKINSDFSSVSGFA